ncbi:SCP2 sterol-binding domain-containing protein [Streptomyces sp. DSM 44917]|uniref:SCP2 sterol-binding domain-containing protein n=1 Tax=Streptomyces boetiae TaxID=3075541 RepID=A0ABU2L7B4_9ACTN|nr:SCP2 sterol-binding domain-containing protein [Streptomyces sp. DSM 44917]MDT0307392.1 SCP2 sterol-binding domain-containing protein [Streptomyces sp. DSM 44917]
MADIADLAALDFASVTPQEFARIVKGLSKKEVSQLAEDSALRTRVISEVVKRMQEQFKPEKAGSLKALIRWEVSGDPVVVYETEVKDGKVTVTEGRSEREPRVTLTANDYEFLRLVSGNASPVTQFMTRKLKVNGDIGLASALPKFFDIPKA